MNRSLIFIGVCVLLFSAKIEANKGKNTKQFWSNLWDSGTEKEEAVATTGNGDDFSLEGEEGSGMGETTDSTHGDDEDFELGSGDGGGSDKDAMGKDDKVDGDDEDYDEDFFDENETDKEDKMEKPGDTDDEDLWDGYSGSGDDEIDVEVDINKPPLRTMPPEDVVETETTSATPLSACQNWRKTAMSGGGDFVPVCEEDGAFKRKQCVTDIKTKEQHCWCVDTRHGVEVKGTKMKSPEIPDCDIGTTFTTCVFQLVQNSQGQLGTYRPECDDQGNYKPMQCEGSVCWCVDRLGNEILNTMMNVPNMPDCEKTTTVAPTTKKQKPVKPIDIDTSKGYNVEGKKPKDEDIDNVIVLPEIDIDKDHEKDHEKEMQEEEEETNVVNDKEAAIRGERLEGQTIMQQPGLLAAIIGGAVVGLLCMVLLVMFIVYRMRKKDEGSYPLDEQRYQNYSYAKAPDKEFYA